MGSPECGTPAPNQRPVAARRRLAAAVVLMAGLAACGQNQSDQPVADALTARQLTPAGGSPPGTSGLPAGHPAVAAPTRQGAVDLGGLTAVVPEGWRQLSPSSSMRVAEFALPGVDGAADANLAVFAGIGGSVEDNVARWVGQFTQPDGGPTAPLAERRTVVAGEGEVGGGLPVAVVAVSGTYNGGMGMGAATSNPGFRMLGAIVETGSGLHYFKVIGPEATVRHWSAAFEAFVASLRQG
ncbi:MAG: hypothetical protein ABIL09_22585 [Gemmatimonadota bacterium]